MTHGICEIVCAPDCRAAVREARRIESLSSSIATRDEVDAALRANRILLRRGAAIERALDLLDDNNLDQGDGMSVDTMLTAIREAREVLEMGK